MPPNLRGGKKYKSSKHQDLEVKLVERDSDQMYGRVIRLLGQRNVMVYCNDNKQRICHICGAMKQRVWINPGDSDSFVEILATSSGRLFFNTRYAWRYCCEG